MWLVIIFWNKLNYWVYYFPCSVPPYSQQRSARNTTPYIWEVSCCGVACNVSMAVPSASHSQEQGMPSAIFFFFKPGSGFDLRENYNFSVWFRMRCHCWIFIYKGLFPNQSVLLLTWIQAVGFFIPSHHDFIFSSPSPHGFFCSD